MGPRYAARHKIGHFITPRQPSMAHYFSVCIMARGLQVKTPTYLIEPLGGGRWDIICAFYCMLLMLKRMAIFVLHDCHFQITSDIWVSRVGLAARHTFFMVDPPPPLHPTPEWPEWPPYGSRKTSTHGSSTLPVMEEHPMSTMADFPVGTLMVSPLFFIRKFRI